MWNNGDTGDFNRNISGAIDIREKSSGDQVWIPLYRNDGGVGKVT